MNKVKLSAFLCAMLTTITLAKTTLAHPKVVIKQDELECLAKNIYHEARNQSIKGQIAVAQVTLNRVKSGKFQSSVCKAVYADSQFSWTKLAPKKIKDRKAWEVAVNVAGAVLTDSIYLPDFKALYYHTKQVSPKWARKKKVVAVIGAHIFYA